jgi:hypothetical protein
MCATCPAHLILLDFITLIIHDEYMMKVLIMQFTPYSCYFLSIGPNILLGILFSNIFYLCSSLRVRDKVSHPYKTTGKIIVLYILIFMNVILVCYCHSQIFLFCKIFKGIIGYLYIIILSCILVMKYKNIFNFICIYI